MKISKVSTEALPSELQAIITEKFKNAKFILAHVIEYELTGSILYVVNLLDLQKDEIVELIFENGKITHQSAIALVVIEKAMELYPEVFRKGLKQGGVL